jgi:hypothetical protein
LSTPHDTLFHYAFGVPRHAAPWLRSVLPRALAKAIDWASLRSAPEKVANRRLRLQVTDPLFEVRLLGTRARLHVLTEHKSGPDPELLAQLLRNAIHLADRGRRSRRDAAVLAIAVVLYHGLRRWSAGRMRHPNLAGLPRPLARLLSSFQPRMRFLFVDISRHSEAQLRRIGTPPGKLVLLCLRFLRRLTPSKVLAALGRWSDLLRAVDREPGPPIGREAIATIAWYCLKVTRVPARVLHATFERILQRPENTMMTTAEKLRREGLKEGVARGRTQRGIELVLRQLTRRFGKLPADVVERIKTAKVGELDRWAVRLLDARTLAAVFAKR